MDAYTLVNAALTGFFGFAALHYLINWWHARSERLLLSFTILCFFCALFCPSLILLTHSATVAEAQFAADWRVSVGLFAHAAALSFFGLVSTGRISKGIWAAVLFLTLMGVLNLFAPLAIVVSLERIPTASGEMASVPVYGRASVWLPLSRLAVFVLYAYGLYIAVKIWSKDRTGALLVGAAALSSLFGTTVGTLVDLINYRIVYVGAVPHSIFVLCMAVFLSREYAARGLRLRKSEERLRLALDAGRLGVWEQDPETSAFFGDDRSFEIFRLPMPSDRKFPFESWKGLVDPKELPGVIESLVAAEKGAQRVTASYAFTRADGAQCHAEVAASAITSADGRPAGVIGMVWDITERKENERQLNRSNRMYAALSRVNETIVHAESVAELDQRVCQVLVEAGGFKVAWIGRPSASDWLVPEAQFGDDTGYLKNIRVSVADVPEGRGPAGIAFRTGQVVVINDFQENSKTAIWREPAKRAGILSSISIPMRNGDAVAGVLVLYAGEKNFFGDSEIKLLKEVGGDLSFSHGVFARDEQRRAAEAGLGASERRLRFLVSATPAIIITCRASDFVPTFVSENVTAILGYAPGDFAGNPIFWSEHIHPDDRHVIATASERFADGALRVREYRFRHRDGRYLWMRDLTKIVRDSAGVPSEIVGCWLDVTELKQAEDALKLREEIFSSIALQALDSIVLIDADTSGFVEFNDAAHTNLGYTREEFARMTLADLRGDNSGASVRENTALIRKSGSMAFESRHRHKNGEIRVVHIRARMVSLRGRAYIAAVWTDITEFRRLTAELAEERNLLVRRVDERTAELSKLNAELGHAVRAKDEFLANMSHELRTPLNAILAFSETLLEQIRGPLNERQQNSVRNIETSGRHLLSLINDILDLSKVEAGRMDLNFENVAVTEVCEASLMFVKELVTKKNVRLDFICIDPIIKVHADTKRLKQILVNLLSNAAKFTESGGRVSLEVRADDDAEVVHFSVRDTGIGMSAESLSRLFKPFSQLDSALNRQHEGTGLGLALVRRLAELHGGGVTVESEVGKGSCFTVSIPRAAREAPKVRTGTGRIETAVEILALNRPASTRVRSGRILLAEDNEFNVQAVGEYLQDKNFRVIIARNGQEAIDLAIEKKPNIILMDIQMPVMDGMEAMRRLRVLPEFERTPIIALTALAMPGDRERCLAAGATEYMTKPVNLKGLVETIERLLKS